MVPYIRDLHTRVVRCSVMSCRIYADLIDMVAEGRGMSHEAVHKVAKGRIWTGQQALGHGLVDQLGGLHDAISLAKQLAELPEVQLQECHLHLCSRAAMMMCSIGTYACPNEESLVPCGLKSRMVASIGNPRSSPFSVLPQA